MAAANGAQRKAEQEAAEASRVLHAKQMQAEKLARTAAKETVTRFREQMVRARCPDSIAVVNRIPHKGTHRYKASKGWVLGQLHFDAVEQQRYTLPAKSRDLVLTMQGEWLLLFPGSRRHRKAVGELANGVDEMGVSTYTARNRLSWADLSRSARVIAEKQGIDIG